MLLGVDGCKPVAPDPAGAALLREKQNRGRGRCRACTSNPWHIDCIWFEDCARDRVASGPQGFHMIGLALLFLVVAVVAGIFGFTGLAGPAAWVAQSVFVVGLVAFVVLLVLGRRGRDTVP